MEAKPCSFQKVKVLYKNWQGETAWRTILPGRLFFGSTEYHPQPQWLLEALDYDKKAERTFSMKDILIWEDFRDWAF